MIPLLTLAILLAAQAPAVGGSTAPTQLAVKGPTSTKTLDAAALAALPHQTVTVSDHGKTRTFSGVPTSVLLADAGAPSSAALHGKALMNVVLATGSDGYRVVFSLAELDPGMRTTKTIVADKEDGKPLSAKDGPFKLVVEGDLRPARSVRGLVGLELKPLP